MRRTAFSVIFLLLPGFGGADAGEFEWPNASIEVPPRVEAFIALECRKWAGSSEESVTECREGERYGYRAVVGLLMDEERGERAAELYRSCQAGLGDHGGRFHRRRAECMGYAFRLVWRFEFMQEA